MKEFYGAIVGDIVGSVYEFANIKTKDFPLFQRRSFATDDSIMTLAVLQALVDMVQCGRFDSATDDEWRELFKHSMLDIGHPYPTCGYGNRFRQWMYSHDPQPYRSCGNGSAMRVSPVAWFARSLEECERLARLTAEPTHDHPDGIAGAQAAAGAVYLALHGASKDEIKEYVERYYPVDFTLDEIRPSYTFDHFAATCAGTVPYAVEAFLESTDFEDCIRNTISIGGDSDTLAAVSGAIAEAFYGVPTKYRGAVVGRLDSSLRSILTQLPVVDWPPEVALPLYVAIATDTGCFAFSNTTGDTHRAAAELIAEGIDYRSVNKRHFRTKTKRRIAMEGELLSGLDFFNDDRTVFLTISLSMIDRLHLDEDDLDNVASLGSQIEGVDCAITLRQQENGDWKASVRTTERVNAAELCAVFGGGGHAEAAGCILHGMELGDVKSAMSSAVRQLEA